MDYWGKHLVLDVKGCNISRAQDPNYITYFTKELVRLIEMVPFGEPQLTHFADGTDKSGWTVIQLIETSSIVGHFLDHNGDLYLDVFSCKDFDENRVTEFVQLCFGPERVKSEIIFRDSNK